MRTNQCVGIFFVFLATITYTLQSSTTTTNTSSKQSFPLEKKPHQITDALLFQSLFIKSKILSSENKNEQISPKKILETSCSDEKLSKKEKNILFKTLCSLQPSNNVFYQNGFQLRKTGKFLTKLPVYSEEDLNNFCRVYTYVSNKLMFPDPVIDPFRQAVALALADQLLKNNHFFEKQTENNKVNDLENLLKDKRSLFYPLVHHNAHKGLLTQENKKTIPPLFTSNSHAIVVSRVGQVVTIDTTLNQHITLETLVKSVMGRESFISISAAPQRSLVAIASKEGFVRIYDTEKGFLFKKGFITENDITHIEFTSSGETIFVAYKEGFGLFSVNNRTSPLLQKKTGSALLFPNDIILWKYSDNIALIDIKTQKIKRCWKNCKTKHITAQAYGPKSERLVIGTSKGDVLVFHKQGITQFSSETYHGSIVKILFSSDEKTIFVAIDNGLVCQIDPTTNKIITTFNFRTIGDWKDVVKLDYIVAPQENKKENDKAVKTFWNTKIEGLLDFEQSNDERYLIVLTNSFVCILDKTTHAIVSYLKHNLKSVKSWRFNPDKTKIILVSRDEKNRRKDKVIVLDLFEKITVSDHLWSYVFDALKLRGIPLQLTVSDKPDKATNVLNNFIKELPPFIKAYITLNSLAKINRI